MAVVDCGIIQVEQEITESVYFDLKTQPETDEIRNSIQVTSAPFTKNDSFQSVYDSDDVFIIPTAGTLEVIIEWSEVPVQIDNVFVTLTKLSGSPVLASAVIFSWGGKITITGTTGSQCTLSAQGKIWVQDSDTVSIAENSPSIREYGRIVFNVQENHLIQDVSTAQSIADGLIDSFSEIRNDARIDWPGNLIVELGSPIELTEYKDEFIETKNLFSILRQSITYTGALDFNTTLRRVV